MFTGFRVLGVEGLAWQLLRQLLALLARSQSYRGLGSLSAGWGWV